MPRGKKVCQSCKFETGPRAFTCPNCGTPFKFAEGKGIKKATAPIATTKAQESKSPEVAADTLTWRDLKPLDYIKVLSGSGPFWKRKNGEREPMGYYGKFRIHSLDENGIHAYPTDTKNSGHCYIYMGPKTISKTGIYNRPHKIRRIKKPAITNLVMSKYDG